VSGLAAAFRHELLPRAPETVEVTVRRRSGPTAPSGIRVRRRDLDRRDLVGIHGIWVTDVPLTVLEVAAALDDGVNAKRAPAVRRLLVAAADRTDPAAERILIKLLRDGGLDGWARGIRFGPYEIDLGFPEVKVAIEVDGWAWRVDADRFARTGGSRTRSSSRPAGRCRGSPGTTCRSGPPRSSPRSGPRSQGRRDHDSGGETDATRTSAARIASMKT
jgi:hypothetical protein